MNSDKIKETIKEAILFAIRMVPSISIDTENTESGKEHTIINDVLTSNYDNSKDKILKKIIVAAKLIADFKNGKADNESAFDYAKAANETVESLKAAARIKLQNLPVDEYVEHMLDVAAVQAVAFVDIAVDKGIAALCTAMPSILTTLKLPDVSNIINPLLNMASPYIKAGIKIGIMKISEMSKKAISPVVETIKTKIITLLS